MEESGSGRDAEGARQTAGADRPAELRERPDLAALLAPLDQDALRAILLGLVKEDPGLASRVAVEVARSIAPPTAPVAPPPAAPVAPTTAPVDVASLRQEVWAILNDVADSYGDWDEGGGAEELTEGIEALLEPAAASVQASDGRAALPVLQAITDELVGNWDRVEGIVYEVPGLFQRMGILWAEALLTADLSPGERAAWSLALQEWQDQGGDSGAYSGLAPAVGAVEQAWDHPPLVRVLRGEATDGGIWEGKAPNWAHHLAIARLNVLERQGRLQEAIRFASAEGEDDRHLALLVRCGRAQEATDLATETLTTTDSVLALAQLLRAHGETPLALRLAEHGLGLQGRTYPLAIWLREAALEEGDTDRAISAAVTAIKDSPRLEDYQHLQELAGERWASLREETLAHLRASRDWNRVGKVDIFLHEGMMDDALDAVGGYGYWDLTARVVEAATPTRPLRVIPICRAEAEEIMNAGKSDRYHHAARWLERARDAYRAAGLESEWQAYKAELLSTHHRKYRLVPLIKGL